MIIKFLKPFSFLPAIMLMYLIYSFSAQDGEASAQLSYQVSYKIVEVGGEVLGAELQPWEIDNLATRFNIPVRKLAHMTEYFLLAIAVAFPLYVYGLRGILLLFMAGLICVCFACGDEYHQAYVAGRGPSKRDVLIDSVGVFFGIILVRIIGWAGRKTIFRPSARRKRKETEMYDDYLQPQRQPVQPAAPQQDTFGYQGQPQVMQQNVRNSYEEDEDYGTSDRLSEDMSFRKLVSDLKGQKQARRTARRDSHLPE